MIVIASLVFAGIIRFEREAIEQVIHAAVDSMVHCTLFYYTVEYWVDAHKLNSTLVWHLDFIEVDFRVRQRVLNLQAIPYQYKCQGMNFNNNWDKLNHILLLAPLC